MTEKQILDALAGRYPKNAWAFFTHVRDSAGFNARRTADALAFGLWPSRGMELHGFEVKVTRSDWQHELKQPEKTEESIYRYCDHWWIAVPENIVKLEEVPKTWGLMVWTGSKWRISKPAPELEAKPIGRSFLAVLMKRLQEEKLEPREIQAAYDAGRREGIDVNKANAEYNEKKLTELQETVREFERLSGVQISTWDKGKIGESVYAVLHGKDKAIKEQVRGIRSHLERLITGCDNLLRENQ